jgi:sucrose-6F-phosphate phosphohydrolase
MERDDSSRPWLLVADVDDTLTGDREALETLWNAVVSHRERLLLVLNSSRPAASVDTTIEQCFPAGFAPDAIITAMGTQIRVDGAWLDEWGSRFLDWPRERIVAIVESLGFEPHADEFQAPAKASFAVPGHDSAAKVLNILAGNGLRFEAFHSGDSDLDILAPGAGKDQAMRFLAGFYDIPLERVVAAGDSGNDLAMFEAAGRSIAVGNARAELIEAVSKEKTYCAKARHAAGVLEGLVDLGILPDCRTR